MRTHALYDGHLCKVNENLFRHANDTPDDFKWVGSAYLFVFVGIIILFSLECGTHTLVSVALLIIILDRCSLFWMVLLDTAAVRS